MIGGWSSIAGDCPTSLPDRHGADVQIAGTWVGPRSNAAAADLKDLSNPQLSGGCAEDGPPKLRGKVGDPNVALGAIEDELRVFPGRWVGDPDPPGGQSSWLETEIVERLREELDIPVTHVIVELAA
jgi:hypothetical protein